MKYLLSLLALVIGCHADTTTTVPPGQRVLMTISVESGQKPFTFQWYKNGAALAGATQDSMGITAVVPSDAGVYTATVANSAGSVTTDKATLVVGAAPTITTQPVSQTILVGQAVTFSVIATGSPTYQWRRNGININGATGPSYTIQSTTTNDVGVYTVVATNGIGSVTSAAANLTITVPVVIPPGASKINVSVGP